MGFNIELEILFAKIKACWSNCDTSADGFGIDCGFDGVCILLWLREVSYLAS